ncbi:MAG: transcriptional regulator [Rhodobacteraceae bacterium]|nr:MAG: transcriptional regulator [Paracoccaceae bacterium]
MLDKLRCLAIFATVVEVGSFTRAAKRLGLSPSVVSQAVSTLEVEAGFALLYRSTRRLNLTDHGARVLEQAVPILRAAEAAINLLAEAESPSGLLRITCPAVLQDGPFIDDLAEFARTNPRVQLQVEFSDHRRHLLRDGFDLALRIGPSDDSALRSRRIIGGTQVLVGASDIAHPTTPEGLSATAMIGLGEQSRILSLTRKSDGTTVSIGVSGQISVDTGHAALKLARIGAGVAAVPRFLAQPLLTLGALVEVLPDWLLPAFDIYAVWPANAGERSLTRLFLTFLTRRLVDAPPLQRGVQ